MKFPKCISELKFHYSELLKNVIIHLCDRKLIMLHRKTLEIVEKRSLKYLYYKSKATILFKKITIVLFNFSVLYYKVSSKDRVNSKREW